MFCPNLGNRLAKSQMYVILYKQHIEQPHYLEKFLKTRRHSGFHFIQAGRYKIDRKHNPMDKAHLENKYLKIEYLTTSLRIISLFPGDKPNLLADLSDAAPISTPFGDFHMLGGHRLWHAPEAMPRTYIPDDSQISITKLPDGVILERQTEPQTGIRKRIQIQLDDDNARATLTHTLINDGLWPVELAPWALTMFRFGGTVILPLPRGNIDPSGLLHNRHFSLWPYARINDPRVRWNDDFILFEADAGLPPFKIGFFNSHGWLAYWYDGILFRKTFDVHRDQTYPDNNCNAEMYCNDQFLELESLGPLQRLNPGASVNHIETWEIFTGMESMPDDVRQALGNS
jgi:hypothetical protein